MTHVSTSYIERQNLTMRMHMRRFTRLTNAFSKKVENHAYSVALHMMYYNFVKIHYEASDDARDGRRRNREALGSFGYRRALGSRRAEGQARPLQENVRRNFRLTHYQLDQWIDGMVSDDVEGWSNGDKLAITAHDGTVQPHRCDQGIYGGSDWTQF